MDREFTFIDNLQKAITASNDMIFHYWLVYASASIKPSSYIADSLPFYFHGWLSQGDIESNRYLRSESFLDSLIEFMKSVAKLYSTTNAISFPAITAITHMDRYVGAMQGSLLELQETPHEVVYRMDDVKLLHYHNLRQNRSPKRYFVPLLIVYAPINRYHIMDIRKGRSIVEHFTSAGFDVYLLDWGAQLNNKPSVSGYIGYMHRAVDLIKKASHSEQVSILGYSWGGVLSMIYSSLRGANVRNLILQSAHVDFHKDGSILASWFRRLPVDDIARAFDTINCHFINFALIMRNPAVHSFDALRFAADMNSWTPSMEFGLDAMRIIAWLNDTPLIPAGFFRDYISKLYQQNQLVNNKLEIDLSDGKPETVDLARITMPLINIVGDIDDICTPSASIPINDIATSKDKKLLRYPTGHIELSVSSAVHKELWPQVVKWLEQRSL